MRKHLLFASLFIAGSSFAQLTQYSEPAIGATATMYLCDSAAPSYSNITGTGVTWDYSATAGYVNETRTLSVVAPATTPNAADFPNATKAIVMEGFLTSYWTSSYTERNSPGFVFEEPSLGTVRAVYNDDAELLATYPFAYNNTTNDVFSGTLYFSFNNNPLEPDANGTASATIDGTGTLILNNTTTLNNVIRYKLVDTTIATIPLFGTAKLVRKQYEYYAAAGGLPVFTYTTAKITLGAGILGEFTVVLNSAEPTASTASLNENKEAQFSIFPNPAQGSVTITGNFNGASSATILDQSGKTVKTIAAVTAGTAIEISDLDKGIYFLVINTNGGSAVERFTKM
jgi:ribosomal protein L30E